MLNIPGLLAFESPALPAILSDGSVYRRGFYIQLFYVGIWDLNPGPHVCTVSTLRTEPYFPLFFSVLETKLILNVAETVLSIVGALSNHLL